MRRLLNGLRWGGGPRDVITLAPTYSADGFSTSPAVASASFFLESDGDITRNPGAIDLGDWIIPRASAGGNYECFATVTSGALSSGTAGSWLSLASNQFWSRTRSGVGTAAVTFTVDIRRVGTTQILGSTTVTLTANVEFGGG